MLENFWFNVEYGLNHVLDFNGYDHILFLIVLTVPYVFKDWKRVLILVSMFTAGHTLSLVLATYDIVSVNGKLVEFLIQQGRKRKNKKQEFYFFQLYFSGLYMA